MHFATSLWVESTLGTFELVCNAKMSGDRSENLNTTNSISDRRQMELILSAHV